MYNYRKIFYKDYYDSQAGREYKDRAMFKNKQEHRHYTKELLPLIPADKSIKILDLGCGFGSFVSLLNEQGYTDVLGIDISAQQVKVAHELGINNVNQSDIMEHLAKHEGEYDLITGIDIIEHFSKDELVNLLLQVNRSLKQGGMALFRTPNLDAPFSSVYAHGDFTHENYMNAHSAEQVMMNMEFKDIMVKPGLIRVDGALKEVVRRIAWMLVKLVAKFVFFASGRSLHNAMFAPNMIIIGKK